MSDLIRFTLVGDLWSAGHRDPTGLSLPLLGEISARLQELPFTPVVVDLTGPKGLGGALRRVAGHSWPAEHPVWGHTSIVLLGTEDAAENPDLKIWKAGLLSLVGQLLERGHVLIVVPPPVTSGVNPVAGFGKDARRWSRRTPRLAAESALEIFDGEKVFVLSLAEEDIPRADDVWLKASGVKAVAKLIADRLSLF